MKLKINAERCKGCGLCIKFCPAKVLEFSEDFNLMGYHPVKLTDESKCTACGICALVCPDLVFEVFREVNVG